jgi:hypothetical protein
MAAAIDECVDVDFKRSTSAANCENGPLRCPSGEARDQHARKGGTRDGSGLGQTDHSQRMNVKINRF